MSQPVASSARTKHTGKQSYRPQKSMSRGDSCASSYARRAAASQLNMVSSITCGGNSGPLASPQQQIDAALASLPGSRLINYELPLEPNDAVKIAVGLHGVKHLVYVHPETLRILKQIEYEAQFMRQVRAFHGELLAGNVGSVLVELAACWAIVLILTGLYLWWPRHSVGLAGVLYPRLRQGRRVLWRVGLVDIPALERAVRWGGATGRARVQKGYRNEGYVVERGVGENDVGCNLGRGCRTHWLGR